jgi:hypothetical protein
MDLTFSSLQSAILQEERNSQFFSCHLLMLQSLTNNGSTCHIVCCHFSFPEGFACDVCDRSCFPSPWLSSHGDYSPTAPVVHSLRQLIPSSSLMRCQVVQVYHHHPYFSRAVLFTSLLLFWNMPTPTQYPVTHFSQPDGKHDCSLHNVRYSDLFKNLIKCLLAPQTQLPSQALVPYDIVTFRRTQRLILNVYPLRVPYTTLSLLGP